MRRVNLFLSYLPFMNEQGQQLAFWAWFYLFETIPSGWQKTKDFVGTNPPHNDSSSPRTNIVVVYASDNNPDNRQVECHQV